MNVLILKDTMTVSGLTVLRNASSLGYQFMESIRSVLPLCDEFIIVVGESDDDTLECVKSIKDEKIRIIESTWSGKVFPQDCVLARQTNIGMNLCKGDWTVYIQGNEVLHEKSYPVLQDLMKKYQDDDKVEALLLERMTFWADYSHILDVYPFKYKYSPRIVKPYKGVLAINGAMGFGVFDGYGLKGRYPGSVDTGEYIYRYGYVCSPDAVKKKENNAVHMKTFPKKYRDDNFFFQDVPIDYINSYEGSHPEVMKEKISEFSENISMEDPRWRKAPTSRERRRLLETLIYNKFGFPKWRDRRYKLVGEFVNKA